MVTGGGVVVSREKHSCQLMQVCAMAKSIAMTVLQVSTGISGHRIHGSCYSTTKTMIRVGDLKDRRRGRYQWPRR